MVNDTVIRNFFYTSTPEHEGVLFHIPSGRFFRVFDEKCKSDFRQIFEIGSLSEDVLEIIDNFRYVKNGITENEVRDLCELCGLDDMIGSLPEGYDTVIGENGSNFSVGQLQRLSIARVLAKNTPIVIFDEPTSSLDLENTKKVLNIINVIKKNKTVLVVSHDENIMECADQVINMNDF